MVFMCWFKPANPAGMCVNLNVFQYLFRGKGGVDNKNYEVTIEFHDDIDVSVRMLMQSVVRGSVMSLCVRKNDKTAEFS